MFHVKHPLQFSCSILRTILIVLGKNFTHLFRFGFADRGSAKRNAWRGCKICSDVDDD